jgi:hypothetical protein
LIPSNFYARPRLFKNPKMAESSSAAPTEEDLGGSSDGDGNGNGNVDTKQPGTGTATIAKKDLIELIRAVKFKNADFSQRQVYQEIVTEIPTKFPQYADSLNPNTLCLNDIKKVWKKAILQQQQQQQQSNATNNNSDLAERLRKMTTNPEVYTVGLNNNNNTEDLSSTGSSMARDYVARFMEEQHAENSVQQRQLLEDYVHVFLDVPADSSVTKKPHQALINFQSQNISSSSKKNKVDAAGKGNKKKQKGKKKGSNASSSATPEATTASISMPQQPPPFEDAIVVKIQMAAPIDENDTSKHPMLLYDQTRTYKTFVHPDGALTGAAGTSSTAPLGSSDANAAVASVTTTTAVAADDDDDGYSRLARWIRTEGVGGALGASGGTKAYFYGRLTTAGAKTNQILSIYVKSLAPPEAQGW